MRWPEFALLVAGLMSCDSRVRAVFAHPNQTSQPKNKNLTRGSEPCP
jgi:hypothetical protein